MQVQIATHIRDVRVGADPVQVPSILASCPFIDLEAICVTPPLIRW